MSTVSSREEGEKIASYLVENKLVACVNITSPIASLYCWEGKVCKEEELMLFMKTRTSLHKVVEESIKELHSYDVPEVISIPITEGSHDYLQWVSLNTRKL
ncbi:MAG: divalent-cation tolerance protein CutA [Nitrospinae bacterium]|nr:divalent-cation tolerance protein CutA [Nitrospinota bacterium]